MLLNGELKLKLKVDVGNTMNSVLLQNLESSLVSVGKREISINAPQVKVQI